MIRYIDIFEEIKDSVPVVREIESAVMAGQDIKLVINCGGGSIHHAFQIHDALLAARQAGCKITCHVAGACCSAANVLLCSASSSTAAPGAVFSFHPTSSPDASGSASDLLHVTSAMLRFERRLADVLVTHTNQKPKTVHSWISGSKWFDAKGAVKAGLVDRIEDDDYRQPECNSTIAGLANLPDDIRNSIRVDVDAALQSIEANCRLGRRALNRSTAEMCLRDAAAESLKLVDLPNVSTDDMARASAAIDRLKASLATDQNYAGAF